MHGKKQVQEEVKTIKIEKFTQNVSARLFPRVSQRNMNSMHSFSSIRKEDYILLIR